MFLVFFFCFYVGESANCTDDEDCVLNSVCQNNTCACIQDYVASKDKLCLTGKT